jgi:branched-chain amino acid transport system substrate-binding protein
MSDQITLGRLRFGRRHRLAALGVLALAVLTACSSSATSSTSSGSSTSAGSGSPSGGTALTAEGAGDQLTKLLGALPVQTGDTTRGINGHVITIGGVGTNTKAGQQTLPGLNVGAQARFARANREGGVDGYTFKYVGFTDDTGLPGPAQQGVQQLVENAKAFAVVPFTSASGTVGTYLNKNKVPYIGWLGQDYCGWASVPYAFSLLGEASCASSSVPGKVVGYTGTFQAYIKASGKKASDVKLAIYGTSDAYAKSAVVALADAAKSVGIKVVYTETDLPSATEAPLTDYTPVATKILQSGANAVYSAVSVPAMLGVTAALKSNGYKGDFLDSFAAQALLQNPATAQVVDGSYALVDYGNAGFGTGTVKRVASDLKAIGSSAPADGVGTLTSYWAADLFIQALKKVTGPLTAEKFANVLNQGGFTDAAIPGLTCSETWPTGRLLAPDCIGVLAYDAKTKTLQPKVPLAPIGGYIIANG